MTLTPLSGLPPELANHVVALTPEQIMQLLQLAQQTHKITSATTTSELFSTWLKTKQSEQTRRSYKLDIMYFAQWQQKTLPEFTYLDKTDLTALTIDDLTNYADCLRLLEEKGQVSRATRRRRLSSIKSFLKFGSETGYIRENVARFVEIPTEKDTISPRILTEREVMKLIDAAEGRDRLILEILYYTGARVSEVATLTWQHIRVNEKGQGIVHIENGKGDKDRYVVIDLELLTDLLASRTTNKPNEPLFKNCYGNCLSDRYMREVVKQACVKAGINKPVSPHWLRHCHATHSQKRGAPHFLTQKTLGHATPIQTAKYSHVDPDQSSGLYLPR